MANENNSPDKISFALLGGLLGIIGGLLKGWMPAFPWLLWKLKREHNIKLVFEAHESTLLTTLYHGFFVKLFGMKHIVFSWENIPFSEKFCGMKGIIHELILRLNLLENQHPEKKSKNTSRN